MHSAEAAGTPLAIAANAAIQDASAPQHRGRYCSSAGERSKNGAADFLVKR
jgi:hypothetical protein